MEERKLTVYYGRGAFKEAPPQILLQGKWLERAGFTAGDKIMVKCQQGSSLSQRISRNQISKRKKDKHRSFQVKF